MYSVGLARAVASVERVVPAQKLTQMKLFTSICRCREELVFLPRASSLRVSP